jgi:hypothetical protein
MRLQNRWLYVGFLLLAPALAVIALASLPPRARAETSSEIVYPLAHAGIESNGEETTPKEAPKRRRPGPQGTPNTSHTVTPKNGEESPAETTPGSEGEPGSKDHRPHAATPGKGGGHPPGGGGGPKEGGSPKSSADPGSAGGKQPERTPNRAIGDEGGGGSSPIVPILIVMAVLAALSIGAVIYRGRTPQAG